MNTNQIRRELSLFVVFEGIDGSGKSTQARMLAERLERDGFDVLLTSEPSDGPVGLAIRALKERLDPVKETSLFTEDRRDHVLRVILPALRVGRVVISDRYFYSSAAYQGARCMDPEAIIEENLAFAPLPDITFLLELPVETAIERIAHGRPQGFSNFEATENLKAVHAIYKSLQDSSIRRIEASQSVQEIHEQVMKIIQDVGVVR
jgi:dTMP kinase